MIEDPIKQILLKPGSTTPKSTSQTVKHFNALLRHLVVGLGRVGGLPSFLGRDLGLLSAENRVIEHLLGD